MNYDNAGQMEAYQKGEYRNILNATRYPISWNSFAPCWYGRKGRPVAGEGNATALVEQGKKISVKNAPSYFGTVAFEIVSDADNGKIAATWRCPLASAQVGAAAISPSESIADEERHRERHSLDGFDPARDLISLHGVKGTVKVESKLLRTGRIARGKFFQTVA